MFLTKKTALATALIAILAAPMAFAQGGPRGLDFDTIDTDGNGELTTEELNAYAIARFSAQDTDGDGELSAAELSAALDARAEERRTRGVERLIERADADGDGALSFDEIGERGSPEERIARIDTDESGTISRAEAVAAAEQMRERREDHRERDGGRRGE